MILKETLQVFFVSNHINHFRTLHCLMKVKDAKYPLKILNTDRSNKKWDALVEYFGSAFEQPKFFIGHFWFSRFK